MPTTLALIFQLERVTEEQVLMIILFHELCAVCVYLILRQNDEIIVNYFVGKKMDVEKKKRIGSEMTMSGLFCISFILKLMIPL